MKLFCWNALLQTFFWSHVLGTLHFGTLVGTSCWNLDLELFLEPSPATWNPSTGTYLEPLLEPSTLLLKPFSETSSKTSLTFYCNLLYSGTSTFPLKTFYWNLQPVVESFSGAFTFAETVYILEPCYWNRQPVLGPFYWNFCFFCKPLIETFNFWLEPAGTFKFYWNLVLEHSYGIFWNPTYRPRLGSPNNPKPLISRDPKLSGVGEQLVESCNPKVFICWGRIHTITSTSTAMQCCLWFCKGLSHVAKGSPGQATFAEHGCLKFWRFGPELCTRAVTMFKPHVVGETWVSCKFDYSKSPQYCPDQLLWKGLRLHLLHVLEHGPMELHEANQELRTMPMRW